MFGLKRDRYLAANGLQMQLFAGSNGQRILASASDFTPIAAAPYSYHCVAEKACQLAPRRFA